MKIKIIFFFSLFLFVLELCNAQEIGISPENKVNPLDTLDFAKIRCEYTQSIVQDTLRRSRKTKDQMLLQIGEKISKFCNYTRFLSDSTVRAQVISNVSIEDILSAGMGKNRGNICYEVFKRYPDSKNTYMEELFFEKFYYEENAESPEWQLLPDTATVLGYVCQKAICTFRCRNYVAWYTPEIPVSEGPWKFTGLPGLILKVSDTKREIVFEAIAIEKINWKDPITKELSSFMQKTDKKKFEKAYIDFKKNPLSVITQYATVDNSDAVQVKSRPYNLIEQCE